MTGRKVLHASLRDAQTRYGGPKRYLRVVVHPDLADFHAGAQAYRGDPMPAAAGCFHPPHQRLYYGPGNTVVDRTDRRFGGVMRLVRGHLGSSVIAHECVHAAAAIYRMDCAGVDSQRVLNLGDDCDTDEETFAYLVGELTAAVVDALYAAGEYKS